MTHVAVPVSSVVAVHVSEPLSVNVTGSFAIGVSVAESVRTAETGVGVEKSPVIGLTVSVVGVAETTVGEVAAINCPFTDSP